MLQPAQFPIIGGVNLETSEDSLERGEVRNALNFLFQDGEAKTRPGVDTLALGSAGVCVYGKSFRLGETPKSVLVASTGKVWVLAADGSQTEITGAGTAFGTAYYHNAEAVNGVILVANTTGGILRWDPTGGTYTVQASAKYRYVTAHLSRAVAAYDITPGSENPRKVGWSIAGDETDWTGIGSGTNILADAPDDITGLGTIRNVVVIARREGFHLAYPTGVTLPVYRFEGWSRKGVGCNYPSTFASEGDLVFCVGQDDVYTFDLTEMSPIGKDIRRELFKYLTAGVAYRGFTSRISKYEPRFLYHLVGDGSRPDLPHFVYDPYEKKWSRHDYAERTLAGFNRVRTTADEAPALLTSGGNLLSWNSDLPCEEPASLITGNQIIGALEDDCAVKRALLRYRDWGVGAVQVAVRGTGGATTREESVVIGIGSEAASGEWRRKWANVMSGGQDFQIRLTVPAGQKFSTNYVSLKATKLGEFRDDS